MGVSPQMIAYLATSPRLLVTLVRVTQVRPDGTTGDEIAVSTHTRPLTFDGTIYTPFTAESSKFQRLAGLSHDNASLTTNYSDTFSSRSLRHSRWLRARVEVNVVCPLHLDYGYAMRKVGQLGDVQLKGFFALPEFRSLSQLLDQTVGEYVMEDCQVVRLGDARCGVDLAGLTADTGLAITSTATVTAVTDRQQFAVHNDQIAAIPDNFFYKGHAVWTTGANAGDDVEIMSNAAGLVTLLFTTLADIAPGDTLQMVTGCDRKRATCRDKFANAKRFRGYPDLPGRQKLLKFPDANQT